MKSVQQNRINQGDSADINGRLQQTPIAIVGMASMFPNARNAREYWDNILEQVDCITDVPASRWNVEDYYDPDPFAPDKTYCKRGGFIPDVEFDPLEFGLPPKLLEATDISQLLSLLVAKQALEDAGYGQSTVFDRENTGVILGAVGRQLSVPLSARLQYPIWERALKNSGISDEQAQKIIDKIKSSYIAWEENSFPGMLSNIISGRIANRLDLGGINCTLDAACASSLAALKMSISELVEHRCNMMLTGGVDPDNSIFTYICFSKTPALTRQQQSKPFDADSEGILLGEGLGIVVLKRLEDAERDGDRIYAVIKGVGVSSDGRYKSIYAPRSEGQSKALSRAYEDAGVDPQTVGLIEAHGTGTKAGDVAEFTGLNQTFSKGNSNKQHIALGSVKSQIGHTKTAAGVASLMKAALALSHKILPATINVQQPNPKFDIENSPFYLNTETRPWIQPEDFEPRRAGISSFGFGGTNYHVVLEEYEREQIGAYRWHSSPEALVLMADSPEQLASNCEELLQQLDSESGDHHFQEWVEASRALEVPSSAARVGFIAESGAKACDKLKLAIRLLNSLEQDSWDHPQGIYYRRTGLELNGKVVALFPGQGSQYLNMGRELALNFPPVRQAYGQLDSVIAALDSGGTVSDVVYPRPVFNSTQQEVQAKKLQRTEYAQPAIGALSVGLFRVMQEAGFQPDFVAGHSFGELTALWAAGVLDDKDYFHLVAERGQAMSAPDRPDFDAGCMLAVQGDATRIQAEIERFPRVAIANFNSDRQVVLAGAKSEILEVEQVLNEQGHTATLLPVSAAFHTPLVGHAQKPFSQAVESVTFHQPKVPVFTNITGKQYPAEASAMKSMLKEHLLNKVLFKQEIETIYEQGGRCFVEIGPRSILTHLVEEILGDRPHIAIALNASRQKDSDRQLREAIVQLRVAGMSLNTFDPYQLRPNHSDSNQSNTSISNNGKGKKPKLSVYLNGANYLSDKTKESFRKVLENGHSSNGYSSNGHASNGHASNGYSSLQSLPSETPTIGEPVAASGTARSNGRGGTVDRVKPPSVTEQLFASKPAGKSSGNGRSASKAAGSAKSTQNGHAVGAGATRALSLNRHLTNEHSTSSENGISSAVAVRERSSSSILQLNSLTMARPASESVTIPTNMLVPSPLLESQALEPQAQDSQALEPQTQKSPSPLSPSPESGQAFPVNHRRILESLEFSLEQFGQHQKSTLEVHGQYLEQQAEYSKTVFKLMQQHNALFADARTGGQADNAMQAVLESSERSITMLHDLQAGTLRVHEQYLTQQTQHAKQVFQLTQQEYDSVLQGVPQSKVPLQTEAPTLPHTPSQLEGQQPGVLSFDPPLTNGRTLSDNRDANGVATLGNGRAQLIAARYREAIDSFRDATSEHSSTEARASESFSGPPAAVVERSQDENSPGTEPLDPSAKAVPPPPSAEPTVLDQAQLSQALLDVVSDKTGYPAEMLETDMDMEADLGIDSIKRVEILGALQERYPDIPQPSLEELAESKMRTLADVAEYMQSLVSKDGFPASAVVEQTISAPPTPQFVPSPSSPAPPAAELNLSPSATETHSVMVSDPAVASPVDAEQLSQTLLDVVSDKTGYPAEMLETDMDMEADLGIDSIKRVEILGALQERYPDIPQPSLEELAESKMRTLGDVVEYMQSLSNGGTSTPAPLESTVTAPTPLPDKPLLSPSNEDPALQEQAPDETTAAVAPANNASEIATPPSAPSALDVTQLGQTLLDVVSDKTGYPAEMLEMEMDMEADLGIDSIKRVEILGALQERYPDMPQPSLEELAENEMRTLTDVVEYMQSLASTEEAPATASKSDIRSPDDPVKIPRATVRLKFLPPPDRLEFSLPDNHCCVVTDDGSPTTSLLAQALSDRGWTVAVLRFPDSALPNTASNPNTVPSFQLENWSEEHLQEQLEKITASCGACAAFVHLNPAFSKGSDGEIRFPKDEAAILKHVFFIAKHLKVSLNDAAQLGRSCFMTVARLDGEFGLGRAVNFSPIGGGLLGLTKSLNYEWKPVFCRAIDLSPTFDAEQAVSQILAELHDPNRDVVEVGCSPTGRTHLIRVDSD